MDSDDGSPPAHVTHVRGALFLGARLTAMHTVRSAHGVRPIGVVCTRWALPIGNICADARRACRRTALPPSSKNETCSALACGMFKRAFTEDYRTSASSPPMVG